MNINEEITALQVRLVGDNIPEQGIYPIAKAMAMADELGLDLVEITAKADPPVCKILDYQKYLYQQKKKAKEMKANAAKVVIKEIRFGPNTDEHDFQFKLKHAQEFLQEGSKVKASVFIDTGGKRYDVDTSQTEILEIDGRTVEESDGKVVFSDTKEEVLFNR